MLDKIEMEIKNRKDFIISLRDQFKSEIFLIHEEKYLEELNLWEFCIQLNDGYSKDVFIDRLEGLGFDNVEIDDSLVLWINNYGEDFDTQARNFLVNVDTSDYDNPYFPSDT
jgi:hypothetical protein